MDQKAYSKFLLFLLIFTLSHTQVVNITNNTHTISTPNQPLKQVVMLTHIQNVTDLLSPAKILKSLAVPGFASKNGYNHVVLEGWSCQADQGLPLKIWQKPNRYLNNSIGNTDEATRATLKIMFKSEEAKLLANAFSNLQNPISNNLNASQCALKLAEFILNYDLDGANIDLKDENAINAQLSLPWLNEFFLQLQNYTNLTFSLSLNVSLFNLTNYPSIRLHLLEKTVASTIKFYVFRYYDQKYAFPNYKDIFQIGDLSVQQLVNQGFPINKIVIGKPSLYSQNGFVPGSQLIQWFKNANIGLSWSGGLAVSPFIQSEAADELREVVKRRDIIEPIIATNLEKVNFWWPPEKTVGDMGVPSFAPNNRYNYFNLGLWTCKNGDFDVARLWSNPTYFLSNKFGSSKAQIQGFLKSKYVSGKKKVLITAFGNAQSPTTSHQDPVICGKSLAAYVINNNLDGVQVKYMDNIAFNQGLAEQWLITFSMTLRNLLPFHIISHSIQDFYLHNSRYAKGGYQRVILQIGNTLDYYSIMYYGNQQTNFDTYEQLFLNSGTQIPQSSVTELVNRGFELNKIVIAKPIRLYDAQGTGYVNTTILRSIFLRASSELNWRAGISFSSYINDQNGAKVLDLIRGINQTDTIRFAYVSNVNMWWPPKNTLGQMGVPVLSSPNMYNFFAYAFWTYSQGPLAISKLYNDPVTYLGSDLGQSKNEIQSYMIDFYRKTNRKLLVSTFGDREFPVKSGIDPILCADKLVHYTLDNQIDGLDIDFEDSQSFIDGTGQNWLSIFMRQLRSALPFHIISHAPQAPYFSPLFSPSGAYLKVHKQVGKYIDFYNIQFYNQGQNTKYDTYETLFIDSGKSNPNTSIFQIIAQGVEPQKIVLGKPVTKTDAYNTGFVQPTAFNSLLKRAKSDRSNPGWKPSLMFWHFLSDMKGEVLAKVLAEV